MLTVAALAAELAATAAGVTALATCFAGFIRGELVGTAAFVRGFAPFPTISRCLSGPMEANLRMKLVWPIQMGTVLWPSARVRRHRTRLFTLTKAGSQAQVPRLLCVVAGRQPELQTA